MRTISNKNHMRENHETTTSPILSILKNTISDIKAEQTKFKLKDIVKFSNSYKEVKVRLVKTTSQIFNPPNQFDYQLRTPTMKLAESRSTAKKHAASLIAVTN